MFYVYFLKSKKKEGLHVYVGYTTDLKERFKKHNEGLVPSTKPYQPWELIFYEAYKARADAKRREMYLKTTKGRKALKLILRDSIE